MNRLRSFVVNESVNKLCSKKTMEKIYQVELYDQMEYSYDGRLLLESKMTRKKSFQEFLPN